MDEASIVVLRDHSSAPLTWLAHTVIEDTGGVDGTLYRGFRQADAFGYPLDLWTPSEARFHGVSGPGHIFALSEEMSVALVRELVTAWCREHLHTSRVNFELGENA